MPSWSRYRALSGDAGLPSGVARRSRRRRPFRPAPARGPIVNSTSAPASISGEATSRWPTSAASSARMTVPPRKHSQNSAQAPGLVVVAAGWPRGRARSSRACGGGVRRSRGRGRGASRSRWRPLSVAAVEDLEALRGDAGRRTRPGWGRAGGGRAGAVQLGDDDFLAWGVTKARGRLGARRAVVLAEHAQRHFSSWSRRAPERPVRAAAQPSLDAIDE